MDRHAAQPARLQSQPLDTPPKLIAAAKAEPGKYSYGSSGVGTSPTLAMELFKQKTGVDLTFISYRGAALAVADVVAGHVPCASPTSIC